jgi:carbon monoxide dehydrogenase subunit G
VGTRPTSDTPEERYAVVDYEGTRLVRVSAESLFTFLAKAENLPRYFPRITSARPTGDEMVDVTAVIDPAGEDEKTVEGEAWFRVDDDRMQIEWGSEGPNDYRGDLEVTDEGDASRVSLGLHTESAHPGVQDSLEETLDRVVQLVEGDADDVVG